MSFAIPTGLFRTYEQVTDAMMSTTTGFASPCQLKYISTVQTSETSLPSIKKIKTMDVRSQDTDFRRGTTSYKKVPVTETINLRVYWDKKDFKRFGNIEVPDGSVMTIGPYSEMLKVNKADRLIINTDKTGNIDWEFKKSSEPTLFGLTNKQFMCFWERV